MRTKQHAVRLSGDEREELRRLIAAGTETARKLMHARILLKADQGPGGPPSRATTAWPDDRACRAKVLSKCDFPAPASP
jgi:hypothetical protein